MRKLPVLLAAAAVLLAACGGADVSEDPKGSLVAALENLGAAESASMTISLDSDAASLNALAREDGGSGLDPSMSRKILDSSLTISTRRGETPAEGQFALTANVAGDEGAFELRMVDDALYLRADVRGIVETFGGNPAEMEAVARQAEGAGMTFVRPAIEGRWVAVRGVTELAKQLGGGFPAQPAKEQERFVRALGDAVRSSATVRVVGEDDAGTHVVASAPVRKLAAEVSKALGSLAQGVPGAGLPDPKDLPEGEVEVDAWLDGETLTRLRLDFLQFAALAEEEVPADVDTFGLVITVDEFDDEVEAPADAVDVDVQQLLQGVMGGAGAVQGGGQLPGSVDCAQFEQVPRKQLEEYLAGVPGLLAQVRQQCPGLGL